MERQWPQNLPRGYKSAIVTVEVGKNVVLLPLVPSQVKQHSTIQPSLWKCMVPLEALQDEAGQLMETDSKSQRAN